MSDTPTPQGVLAYAVGDHVALHGVIAEIDPDTVLGLPYRVRIGGGSLWFPTAVLTPDPPPGAPGWCWLPKRRTALNLAHVSRVEFTGAYGTVYLDHAECDDADAPGFVTTAVFPVHGPDVAAIRVALGVPAGEDTDA